MMYDITWCANRTCRRSVLKLDTDKVENRMLSFAGFAPDEHGECKHYWPEKAK